MGKNGMAFGRKKRENNIGLTSGEKREKDDPLLISIHFSDPSPSLTVEHALVRYAQCTSFKICMMVDKDYACNGRESLK